MIKLEITFDARGIARRLDEFAKKQIRYGTARALTATAKAAIPDLQAAMRSDFNAPTPYTLNAFRPVAATKGNPVAYVAPRQGAGSGTPGWKYLTPEIEGGARRMKRFERRIDVGFLVPGRAAEMDQYHNIARAEIGKVIAQLNAAAAATSNPAAPPKSSERRRGRGTLGQRDARLKRRPQFFLGKSKDGTLGIYQVISTGHVARVFSIRPAAPTYSPRLPYWEILTKSARANFPREFQKALAQAWATARR